VVIGVLDQLGLKYGTDKASSGHNYLHFYERLFAPLRDKPITFLEFGLGSANMPSLTMWRDYFPLAKIIGVDNDEHKCNSIKYGRILTLVGDQGERAFLENLVRTRGPFDIVLDDAGHSKEHQLLSFEVLSRHINPGGFYVIEDMINREVADMVASLAHDTVNDFERKPEFDKIRSVSLYKGTAVVEFN
jgi:cephalosporin hydroxylase